MSRLARAAVVAAAAATTLILGPTSQQAAELNRVSAEQRKLTRTVEGGALPNPVVLMHNAPAGDPATALALPRIILFFRHHGYRFVNLLGDS